MELPGRSGMTTRGLAADDLALRVTNVAGQLLFALELRREEKREGKRLVHRRLELVALVRELVDVAAGSGRLLRLVSPHCIPSLGCRVCKRTALSR